MDAVIEIFGRLSQLSAEQLFAGIALAAIALAAFAIYVVLAAIKRDRR